MTNTLDKDFRGVDFSGQDLFAIDFSFADLRDANLSGCDLDCANFYRADLAGVNFHGATLRGAKFERSDLYGADLSEIEAPQVTFEHAYLCGTTLKGSNLQGSSFEKAYMFGTCLDKCDLTNSSLKGAHLVQVSWLGATLNHILWNGDTELSRPPISIYGLDYPVSITPEWMDVGCQGGTLEWFENDTPGERGIAALEGLKSARFWKRNKRWIFDLINSNGINKS